MPPLAAVRAANAAFSASYLPVAVFVGGTSGIGRATAHAFAQHTRGNAHIVIVGRNRAAATSLIASFPPPTAPGATHEFVACTDAARMRDVAATTAALRARLPGRLNFLVLTPGFLSVRARDETDEGIDRRLSVHYYARWKFVNDLLPLLRAARDADEDAKVLSVLSAGIGVAVDVDNLGLKKNYLRGDPARTSPTYTDLMIQSFAEQHPDIAFVHSDPGAVRTDLFARIHWTTRILNPLVMALTYPFSVSPEECGEYMLYGLLQTKEGASRRSSRGDDIGKSPLHDADDIRKRVWDHTKEEIERALAVKV